MADPAEIAPRSSAPKFTHAAAQEKKSAESALRFAAGNSDNGAREEAFRAGFLGIEQKRIDTKLLRVWESFAVRYAERRSQIGTH